MDLSILSQFWLVYFILTYLYVIKYYNLYKGSVYKISVLIASASSEGLRHFCAYAQPCQSIRCSNIRIKDVDERLDKF